jgi:hypothetical protein
MFLAVSAGVCSDLNIRIRDFSAEKTPARSLVIFGTAASCLLTVNRRRRLRLHARKAEPSFAISEKRLLRGPDVPPTDPWHDDRRAEFELVGFVPINLDGRTVDRNPPLPPLPQDRTSKSDAGRAVRNPEGE